MGKCCGQGSQGGGNYKQPTGKGQCVSANHNEEVCHGTNERRRDLLDQVKIFLDEFDDRPCQQTPPQTGPDALRPLSQYPEYMKKHCQSWMPANPRPPLITGISVHEVRPTGNVNNIRNENTEYVSYKDARMKPPNPSCDCAKRNGLQDQCEKPGCKPPTPQCLASNPGPCCPPSMGLTGREVEQGAGPMTQQGSCCRSPPQQNKQNPNYFSSLPQQMIQPQQQLVSEKQPQMICFCNPPATGLPPGKKYLCCPLPQE